MNRAPVLVVTGFLGAGKTTFVNWLLTNFPDKKISVILNEFGDITLESQFITTGGLQVAEIANGCMCCAAQSDVPLAIRYVLEHAPQTEYIVVEASGLSDPEPIKEVLTESTLIDTVYLESTWCFVDALNFLSLRSEYRIITTQLGDADVVVLNKTKVAGPELTSQVHQAIKALLPMARIADFDLGIPLHIVFDPDLKTVQAVSSQNSGEAEHVHNHTHQPIDEWWFKTNQVFDPTKLTYFFRELDASVVRAKGVVNVITKDQQSLKILISFVAGKVTFLERDWASDETPVTGIIFLGKQLNRDVIKAGLDEAMIAV
jgi:G3E family GTPase